MSDSTTVEPMPDAPNNDTTIEQPPYLTWRLSQPSSLLATTAHLYNIAKTQHHNTDINDDTAIVHGSKENNFFKKCIW
jgi:hypothetical protein